jgi:hypothetical protein
VALPPTPAGPGSFIREFGRRLGWNVSTCNIIVEGTTDVAYFKTAARLYQKTTRLTLVGDGLSVFAIGDRDAGGTDAMLRYLPALRGLLPTDPVDHNGRPFRFIVLLDSDAAGRGMARKLCSPGVGLRRNREVFVLQRAFPSDTRDPNMFEKKCTDLNCSWASLDCEIEDLVHRSVLEAFLGENPAACQRAPTVLDNAHHYDWHGFVKPALSQFVDQHALAGDVEAITKILQALRYMLELVPEGLPSGT